jgi:exosortase sorting signal-containing protein
MTDSFHRALACAVLSLAAAFATPAYAARVGVLSNRFFAETAADFSARIPGHTFTGVDVSTVAPSLASLAASYDVLLLFEDLTFTNAPVVGNVVAAFAGTGRSVVLGTFYNQDRSDNANPFLSPLPHGWGNALEAIDPNTTDGIGVATDALGIPNVAQTLNAASVTAHPLTAGVATLFATTGFAGGDQAKAGTIVLATWTRPNARNQPDPAIAYRVTGAACVINVGIAPHYAAIGTFGVSPGPGVSFGGDFYRAWTNAFDFAAAGCVVGGVGANDATAIPTLSNWSLALTALLVVAVGFAQRRRVTCRAGRR